VGATVRLVLFPTWLLLDLLGVVMLSTFGYEQIIKSAIFRIHVQFFYFKHTARNKLRHGKSLYILFLLNYFFVFMIKKIAFVQ